MVRTQHSPQNRQKISQPHLDPLPADPLGQRICEMFPYRWHTISAVNPKDSHSKPDWHTVKNYPLRPRVLWDNLQNPDQLVGVRFGTETAYAVVDIDNGGRYHPNHDPDALDRIIAALEDIGIVRSLLTCSSDRGGLHLYLPLPHPVPTFGLAVAIKQCLEAQGFSVEQGHLEIFPNVKSYGKDDNFVQYQAHNLPLQPASGSILLHRDGSSATTNLEVFVSQWDLAAAGQDMRVLNKAITTARSAYKGTPEPWASRKTETWKQNMLIDIEAGWTGQGQTNSLLKTIACYGIVFEKLGGQDLVDYVERIAKSRPGYNQWCRHQHEIASRAQQWAAEGEKRYYPLGSKPDQQGKTAQAASHVVPLNQQRAENAQLRIKRAVEELEEQGRLPESATARLKEIVLLEGVSSKTLYRYQELWHPDHRPVPQTCKTAEPEGVPAISALPLQTEQKPEKADNSKEFYTSPPMKGKTLLVEIWSCLLNQVVVRNTGVEVVNTTLFFSLGEFIKTIDLLR